MWDTLMTRMDISAKHNSEFLVVEDMRESAKNWSNLIMIFGGSLASHKTSWKLLVWEMEGGELKLITATKEVIMMGDGKGVYTVIDFKSLDVPNEGLGYCICPDGNQGHVHEAIMMDMRELCGRVLLS